MRRIYGVCEIFNEQDSAQVPECAEFYNMRETFECMRRICWRCAKLMFGMEFFGATFAPDSENAPNFFLLEIYVNYFKVIW